MESLLQRSFSTAAPVQIPVRPSPSTWCSACSTFSGDKISIKHRTSRLHFSKPLSKCTASRPFRSSTASIAPEKTRLTRMPGGDRRRMRCYYEEMLRLEPTNALILSNYGKYLHEVEGDLVKAQHYYGKAILASPGDGEVLSLYARLVWELQRDENRAASYFDQAVKACPNDSAILGSYALFLWESEAE